MISPSATVSPILAKPSLRSTPYEAEEFGQGVAVTASTAGSAKALRQSAATAFAAMPRRCMVPE